MEEMDEAGSDGDEGVEMEEGRAGGEAERKVYVPGMEPLQPGVELEMDRTAYRMYHECQTGEWTQPPPLQLLLQQQQQLQPRRQSSNATEWFHRVALVCRH